MTDITEHMKAIVTMDPQATLKLSTWTGKWYVNSMLSIGDGTIVKGITEHQSTPEQAVSAFMDRLTSHGPDEYITDGKGGDDRRNWRWTGFLFREVPTHVLQREFSPQAKEDT